LGRSFDFNDYRRGGSVITESPKEEGGVLNVTCPQRRGGRLFDTLKSNFAVFKHLGWLVADICQLTSVTGFSVERRNFTGCKIECSRLFRLLKFVT